jgi:hypothetical protein
MLTVSSLISVSLAMASVTQPSVPEFNVKFVDLSYNVTTTDPYTGANVTQLVDNRWIDVIINNQPFAYPNDSLTYHLCYNIRVKPHFEENWTELYPLSLLLNSPNNSLSTYLAHNSPLESNSDITFIAYKLGVYIGNPASGQSPNPVPLFVDLPPNAQVDFQVEAIVGHDSQYWYWYEYIPNAGYYVSAIAFDDSSGWSNTQTLTIPTSTSSPSPSPSVSPSPSPSVSPSPSPSVSPSPSPSVSPSPSHSPSPSPEPTPEAEPFPTTLVITASGVLLAVVCIGLFVYFKKSKRVVD